MFPLVLFLFSFPLLGGEPDLALIRAPHSPAPSRYSYFQCASLPNVSPILLENSYEHHSKVSSEPIPPAHFQALWLFPVGQATCRSRLLLSTYINPDLSVEQARAL